MNLWIETERDSLVAAIAEVDCVLLNDAEIRMLTGEPNLARAARAVMAMGPQRGGRQAGRVRRGPVHRRRASSRSRAILLEDVRDPTGAGDSFAGGFLGYLDGQRAAGLSPLDPDALRQAMAYGSVLASFNVEDFGTERVASLTMEEIAERLQDFKRITHFDVPQKRVAPQHQTGRS